MDNKLEQGKDRVLWPGLIKIHVPIPSKRQNNGILYTEYWMQLFTGPIEAVCFINMLLFIIAVTFLIVYANIL